MRLSALHERREFYEREFRTRLVRKWFMDWTGPLVFAVVIGRHTRIYPTEYRADRDRTILIDEYDSIRDLERYCVDFKPESVYYDRNVYKNWDFARRGSNSIKGLGRTFGQQLAFDIDPENFDCPIHGSLEDKMRKGHGLSFCRLELQLAQGQAFDLVDRLSKRFADVRLVYSGRGFHVHVMDGDAFFWTRRQRVNLVRDLSRRGYFMDEWVSGGGMRLIRLPYSLNGLVSRLAIPLERSEPTLFDPVTDPRCLPTFARS
jgi:DNA primase catalytic subunit